MAGRSPSTSTFECSEGGSYMTRGRSAKANKSGFGFVEVYKVRDNVKGSSNPVLSATKFKLRFGHGWVVNLLSL